MTTNTDLLPIEKAKDRAVATDTATTIWADHPTKTTGDRSRARELRKMSRFDAAGPGSARTTGTTTVCLAAAEAKMAEKAETL